jgi:hypothetical protein
MTMKSNQNANDNAVRNSATTTNNNGANKMKATISTSLLRKVVKNCNTCLQSPDLPISDRQTLVMRRETAYTAIRLVQAGDASKAIQLCANGGIETARHSIKSDASYSSEALANYAAMYGTGRMKREVNRNTPHVDGYSAGISTVKQSHPSDMRESKNRMAPMPTMEAINNVAPLVTDILRSSEAITKQRERITNPLPTLKAPAAPQSIGAKYRTKIDRMVITDTEGHIKHVKTIEVDKHVPVNSPSKVEDVITIAARAEQQFRSANWLLSQAEQSTNSTDRKKLLSRAKSCMTKGKKLLAIARIASSNQDEAIARRETDTLAMYHKAHELQSICAGAFLKYQKREASRIWG